MNWRDGLRRLARRRRACASIRTRRRCASRRSSKPPAPRSLPATIPAFCPRRSRTQAEIAGARAAHIRDGAAMARFLAWLDAHSASGRVDEIGAAMKLEEFRRDTGELKDLSFDSISAAGPHGAVVHYRPTTASNLRLKPRSLYLINSGAQYADGTTDVTRTIAIGTPSATMRRHYTLVAQGPYRHRLGAIPQGHARAGYRPVRAQAAVGGRARFRPRNGPWRRQLPLGA